VAVWQLTTLITMQNVVDKEHAALLNRMKLVDSIFEHISSVVTVTETTAET